MLFYKSLHKYFFSIIMAMVACMPMIANSDQIAPQPLADTLPAKPGTHFVTDDWLSKLPARQFYGASIEWLDNHQAVYTLPALDRAHSNKIASIDVRTGAHHLLGEGETPKPSPDGQWIAFTKNVDKARQLWLMRSNGTEARKLAQLKSLGVYKYNFDLQWSPDSRHIALSHLSASFQGEIDVIDVANAKKRHILSTNGFQLRSLSWFPNGKELLFWKEQIEGQHNAKEDQEFIQSIRLSDGYVRTWAKFAGLQQFLDPVISPDGQQIAIMYDPDHPYFDTTQNIGLILTNSSNDNALPAIARLTSELKLIAPQWSRDGQSIFAIRIYGAYKQLYNINAKTGELKQVTNSPSSIYWNGYALSPDGKQLAWLALNAHDEQVLRVATSDGQSVRDLITISNVPAEVALSEIREIEWDTRNYPTRMRGLLLLPLNYQEGSRYPLVVDIHGGGSSAALSLMGGILVSTPLEWQMWTAKGYAVFVPELRSSGAFGALADTRDNLQEHNIIDCDIIDVETGVDALVARGIVDRQRIAIIGHSAGGRRANWLTVTRHQFQAVVAKEGWAEEITAALNPPPNYPINRVYRLFGGSPQQVPENYLKNSALFHSSGATTPTLFLMGNPKLGGADSQGTVRLLYDAIKARGIETQYVYYPDEGHALEKAVNQLDALRRIENWIDEHTKVK